MSGSWSPHIFGGGCINRNGEKCFHDLFRYLANVVWCLVVQLLCIPWAYHSEDWSGCVWSWAQWPLLLGQVGDVSAEWHVPWTGFFVLCDCTLISMWHSFRFRSLYEYNEDLFKQRLLGPPGVSRQTYHITCQLGMPHIDLNVLWHWGFRALLGKDAGHKVFQGTSYPSVASRDSVV